MSNKLNRRNFINTVSAAGAGLAIRMPQFSFAYGDDIKPAMLGGNFPNGRYARHIAKT